jgi:coatomer subunit beta'
VIWSGSGELVAIIADDSFYVLRFDRAAYDAKVETGADLGDEGVEEAFDIIAEIAEGCIYLFSSSFQRRLTPFHHP